MKTYQVGFSYTVWVTVAAEDQYDAVSQACAVDYDLRSNQRAKVELNEFEDPLVYTEDTDQPNSFQTLDADKIW